MFDRIEKFETKLLCGISLNMSLANNRTYELWSSFMPLRKKIENAVSTDLYSMQVYGEGLDFNKLNPTQTFTKWAAIEVSDHSKIPEKLFPYILGQGLYAVFIHTGTARDFPKTFDFIFNDWIPNSQYEVDSREHFELIPETYKPDDPMAKEEVYIPVKERNLA